MTEEPAAAVTLATPRARLDRELILAAAEAIVAAEGVGRLTMRRIGNELGADPTAVYRHFRNKRELLVELADRLFGTDSGVGPEMHWRERFAVEMRFSMHRYRSHPDLAALLATQPADTPALRGIAERTLSDLRGLGLSVEQAAAMFHVMENHVVGAGLYFSQLEHIADPAAADQALMRRTYAALPPDEHPHIVAAADHLFPDLDESFEIGTEIILDAVQRLADQARSDAGPHPSDEGTTT